MKFESLLIRIYHVGSGMFRELKLPHIGEHTPQIAGLGVENCVDYAIKYQDQPEPEKTACWGKDCDFYSVADDGIVCASIDSQWCSEYRTDYDSCEHCVRRVKVAYCDNINPQDQ